MLLAGCGGANNVAVPTPLQALNHVRVQPSVIWSVDGGNGTNGEVDGLDLGVSGNTVYVANYGGGVAAYDIDSGDEIWWRDSGKHLISGPTVAGNILLVGTRDAICWRCRAATAMNCGKWMSPAR